MYGRLCQERLCNNGRNEAWFGNFKLSITVLFMVKNIKCGSKNKRNTLGPKLIQQIFLFRNKNVSSTVSSFKEHCHQMGWVIRPEFLLVDLWDFFSDLGSGGRKKINKKALKMTR